MPEVREISDHRCCGGSSGWVAEIKTKAKESDYQNSFPGSDACTKLQSQDWGDGKIWAFSYRSLRRRDDLVYGGGGESTFSSPSFRCLGNGKFLISRTYSSVNFTIGIPSGGTDEKIYPDDFGTYAKRLWSTGGCDLGLIRISFTSDELYVISGGEKLLQALNSEQVLVSSITNSTYPEASFAQAEPLDSDFVNGTFSTWRWAETVTWSVGGTHDLDCVPPPSGQPDPEPEDIDDNPKRCAGLGLKGRDDTPYLVNGYAVNNSGSSYLYSPQYEILLSNEFKFCGCDECEMQCGDCCIDLASVAKDVGNSMSKFVS